MHAPSLTSIAANCLTGRVDLAVLLLLGVASAGCAKIPEGRSAVDRVDVRGNEELGDSQIETKIATRASPKALGLFRGVIYDYEVFDRFVLGRDLARIERLYRAQGHYKARARAARVFYDGPKHVRVSILVEEGPVTRVAAVSYRGLDEVDAEVAEEARAAAEEHVAEGEIFEEAAFAAARVAVEQVLGDHGYARARVDKAAEVDLVEDSARVAFEVRPGRRAVYGPIRIEGLGSIPEDPVRRALDLTPGDPWSRSELVEAKQAVLDLGVLSSVEIEATDSEGDVVPLVVRVEPSKLRQLELGGGAQIDMIRSDVHLLARFRHRSFLGGLRRLSLDLRPGLVFFPTRFPSFERPTAYLPELRARAELRQPGFIEARLNASLRAEYSIYPVLLSPDVDRDASVLGYRELVGSLGVDRSVWRFYARPSWGLQIATPFTYRGGLDPDLRRLVISYGELFLSLDLSDDRLSPHEGVFLSSTLESAGGPFGGHAEDVKLQPEARVYLPLGDDATLATRATTGLLFPRNYGSTTASNAETGAAPAGVDRRRWVRDVQVSFFRSFFSGGPSSNRGYALRGVGPHGAVPFFNPDIQAQLLADRCRLGDAGFDRARCELPLGGLTLWEASVELRYAVKGPLSAATFCDASDVSPRRVDYRFDRPHLSCGQGARLRTPVGPVRLDVGYRIPEMQTLGSDSGEGEPTTVFGAPIAVAIAIGEAF